MDYIFFDKKTSCGAVKNEYMTNREVAEELHKSITKKLKKRKVYSSFIDNIWGPEEEPKAITTNFFEKKKNL